LRMVQIIISIGMNMTGDFMTLATPSHERNLVCS